MVINTINDLLNYIDIPIDDITLLPICHTSSIDILINKIIPKGKILKPKLDTSYNEDILFFFYGKAKYILKDDFENKYKKSPPFTLIYKIEAIVDETINGVHRFVCFDSGGFEKYKAAIDREHFEISKCHTDVIKKFIKAFYGNNTNYLNSSIELKIDPDDFPFCGAIKEYNRIAKDAKDAERDLDYGEQALTIELQVANKEINLNPDTVVMPDSLLTSNKAMEQFNSLFNNAKLATYAVGVQGVSYQNMSMKVKTEIEKSNV